MYIISISETNHILQSTDIASIKPNFEVLKLISKSQASEDQVLVYDKKDNQLLLLTTNNVPSRLTQIISSFQNKNYTVDTYFTDDIGFQLALGRYDQMLDFQKQLEIREDYRLKITGKKAVDLIKETLQNRAQFSEVDLINELVRLSFQAGASDMHLQSEQQGVVLRLRINGVLQNVATLTHEEYIVYLMKIKYISGVKINIAKTPQDGRFDFWVRTDGDLGKGKDSHRKIDARVSFMPGLRGESIVIRFLDSSQSIMTFSEIGFSAHHIPVITRNLQKNSGLILMTGPTGSGKTTTLYSMLQYLNNPDIKIVTLEDPVEYEIPGIQQSQIHEDQGYTFAEGVRSVLRHDPDVILVGEIRDLDTANAAINAALTGHLVFSTLHTNSALEAIGRLLNLGVKPYLLAPAINMIVGQRLIRKLGPDKVPVVGFDMHGSELEESSAYVKKYFANLLPSEPTIFAANPDGEGYVGRVAAAEIFEPDDMVRKLLLEGKLGGDIFDIIRQTGYMTMWDDGVIKVWDGVTTLEELRRII
ncbi:MAG: GspE/PulE family protein [Candidatus Absconditabacterales bacterium]